MIMFSNTIRFLLQWKQENLNLCTRSHMTNVTNLLGDLEMVQNIKYYSIILSFLFFPKS